MGRTFSNSNALKTAVMREAQKAMEVVRSKVEPMLYENVGNYYTGSPKTYIRTAALANTPMVTGINFGTNTVSFQALLEQSHNYSTGKWSMPKVLKATESGALVGTGGYWAKSEDQIQEILDASLSSFFK